jgi:hypothetical protein
MNRMLRTLGLLACASACGGGNNNPSVECKETADCNLNAGGACMVNAPTGNKWCAYPAADCPSGYRWSSFGTGDGLAGQCVAEPDAGPPSPTLTVMVGGNGMGRVVSDPVGIDCPGVCSSTFSPGTKVTLTQTASQTPPASLFLGWSEACSGTGPCVVTVNSDSRVGVLFGIPGSNVWLKQLHASRQGTIYSAKAAANGDIVVGGTFVDTMMPGTTLYNASSGQSFVARLASADGAPIWVKQFTGNSVAAVDAVDVDANGDVIAAGNFQGTANFGGGSVTSAGNNDVFVVKLKGSDGSYVWSKTFGGTAEDLPAVGTGVAFDPQNNVIVAGQFSGSIKPGTQTLTSNGMSDIFLAKYNGSTGAHVWSKNVGGTDFELINGMAVDGSGNVTVTGVFGGTVDNFGGGNFTNKGGADVFVAKYATADGAYLLAKTFGTVNDDFVTGVAVDSPGNIYVTGFWDSTKTLDVGGATPLSGHGQYDVYVVKYTIAGAHAWSEAFGNQYPDTPYSIRLDVGGHILLATQFEGSISYGSGPILSSAGGYDIAVVQLSSTDGTHVGSMRLGGSKDDTAYVFVSVPGFRIFAGGSFTGFAEFGGEALTAASQSSSDGYSLLLMPLN